MRALRRSGSRIEALMSSQCLLCELCGEISRKKSHHRDTETSLRHRACKLGPYKPSLPLLNSAVSIRSCALVAFTRALLQLIACCSLSIAGFGGMLIGECR